MVFPYTRIRGGRHLIKISWRAASHDKELMLLLGLAFLISAVVVAAIAVPAIIIATNFGIDRYGYALLTLYGSAFLGFALMGGIFTYFKAAQIAGMYKRLNGGNPTVWSSLKDISHFPSRMIKATFSRPITYFTKFLSKTFSRELRQTGSFALYLHIKWLTPESLMLPVMIFEDLNPKKALERIGQTMDKSWEEQYAGNIRLSSVGLLFVLPVLVALVSVSLVAVETESILLIIVGLAVAIFYIMCFYSWWSLVQATHQAALYIYATTGKVPEAFAEAGWGKQSNLSRASANGGSGELR